MRYFFLQNDIYNIIYGYLCTYFIIIISQEKSLASAIRDANDYTY